MSDRPRILHCSGGYTMWHRPVKDFRQRTRPFFVVGYVYTIVPPAPGIVRDYLEYSEACEAWNTELNHA
jgi:hypothetical protein